MSVLFDKPFIVEERRAGMQVGHLVVGFQGERRVDLYMSAAAEGPETANWICEALNYRLRTEVEPPSVEGMTGWSPDIGSFTVREGKAHTDNGGVLPFPPTPGCAYRFLYSQFTREDKTMPKSKRKARP